MRSSRSILAAKNRQIGGFFSLIEIHGSDTLVQWRETGFSWKNHGCDDGGGVRDRAEKSPLGKTRVDAPFGIFERRGEERQKREREEMNELKICRHFSMHNFY